MTKTLNQPDNQTNSHLHCQVVGDENNPPLLLVHGYLSSNLQWELNQKSLLRHFRLFMVELWGHGHSPTPPYASNYSIKRYIEEFERIRQQHDVKQWGLIGPSYGGVLSCITPSQSQIALRVY